MAQKPDPCLCGGRGICTGADTDCPAADPAVQGSACHFGKKRQRGYEQKRHYYVTEYRIDIYFKIEALKKQRGGIHLVAFSYVFMSNTYAKREI